MLLPSFFLFQLSAALTSTSQTSSLHDTTQPTTNENSAETVYIATNGDGGSTTTTTSPRVNSTHSGDLVLHNAHFLAVDFSQFSNLTDIEGRLIIESSTLRNLEFLKNIQQINTAKAVGDAMIIRCNIFTENLTSILPNLKQIHSHKGLALRIEDNYNQALTKKEEQRLEKLFSKNMIISDASQEAKIEKNGKKNKGMDSLSFCKCFWNFDCCRYFLCFLFMIQSLSFDYYCAGQKLQRRWIQEE